MTRTKKAKATAAPKPQAAPAIVVQVPREDRLATIASLARSIESLAHALTVVPSISITNSHFAGEFRIEPLGTSTTYAVNHRV